MEKSHRDSWLIPLQRTLADVSWFGPTLSAVLLAALINVLTDTLNTLGGPLLGWFFIFLLIIATTGFVIAYNQKYHQWRRNIGPIADIESPRKFEGLIAIFSRKDTLLEAIEHHLPELKHCWLIVTPEMQAAAGATTANILDVRFSILPITNLYNTQACYEIVRHIYNIGTRDLDIEPENVIADITGGTKPMTMGMIVACLEGGFPIEHIPTKYDSTGKPLGPLPPIEIRVQQS
ncbi:MAG: hypothetical protein AB1345_02870 [Chloroflexota bacterium]